MGQARFTASARSRKLVYCPGFPPDFRTLNFEIKVESPLYVKSGGFMSCENNGSIDWNAIGAISTASAAIIALLASWLALKAPEWSRKAERRDATQEVLRAVREALAVYHGAAKLVESKAWPDDLTSLIRIRASHLHATLDRLLNRPSLTDGAIAIGAGAMSVLNAIIGIPNSQEAKERAFARSHNPNLAQFIDVMGPAKVVLDSAGKVVEVIEVRVRRVEDYMKRPLWHRLAKRWRSLRDMLPIGRGVHKDTSPLDNSDQT